LNDGNFTVQNHYSGRVLVGQGDPTIIMVLNGKVSIIKSFNHSIGADMAVEATKFFFLVTMSSVAHHTRADYSDLAQ
jgi:hypothetical protein